MHDDESGIQKDDDGNIQISKLKYNCGGSSLVWANI